MLRTAFRPRRSWTRPLARLCVGLLAITAACDEPTRPARVASVELSAPWPYVDVGQTMELSLTARAASGNEVAGRKAEWSSSNEAVATVADGVVTGRAVGTATITASVQGNTDQVEITVEPTAARINAAVPTQALAPGVSVQFRFSVVGTTGETIPDHSVQWTSSAPSVATVDSGLVRAVAVGTTVIAARAGSQRAEFSFRVLPPYTLTYFGAGSEANGLNDSGQVVGTAGTRAFLWEDGKATPLGEWTPRDLDDRGRIVGSVRASDSNLSQAVLWENGRLTTLLALPDRNAEATGINDAGEIVGFTVQPSNPCFTVCAGSYFVVRDGQVHEIASGFYNPRRPAINDQGWVVGGASFSGRYDTRALLYRDGTLTSLPPSDYAHTAHDVNDRGQIVGGPAAPSFNPRYHALLWDGPASPTVLPSPGEASASGINDAGEIVGRVAGGAGGAGVLWRGGEVLLLTYLQSDTTWEVVSASKINSHGWIVGTGRNRATGERGAVLLRPVSE